MKNVILILEIFRKNDANGSRGLCLKSFHKIEEESEMCPF